MADSQADSVQSSIIMKVDGPAEENENDENEANSENAHIDDHSICSPSRPINQSSERNPSTKVSSTSSSNDSTGNKSILRPSQLSKQIVTSSNHNKPFTFNPSKLHPFVKASTSSEEFDSSHSIISDCENGESPKFVPLITSSGDSKKTHSSHSTTSNANFVFGQNLQARVLNETNCTSSSIYNAWPDSSSDDCRPSTSFSSSNGTCATHKEEMLFSSAIKETPMHESRSPVKSLTESAREYEEQRNNKRKYEEVETKTGEEDEVNVMQISCKLFAYDASVGNWQERGRGILRLNDLAVNGCADSGSEHQSRLVFRNSGVHKVILNTKIWAEMTIEQASAKSIRLTAIDTAGEIRVFLVMASAEEIKQLFTSLITRRSNELRRQHGSSKRFAKASPCIDSSVSTTSAKVEDEGQQCTSNNDDQGAECN